MRIVDNDPDRIGKFVFDRCGGTYIKDASSAIGMESNGQIVGGVVYDHYTGRSIVMNCAGDGHWLNREFLWFAFYYPFMQLKVKKILLLIDSTNQKSLRFVQHLGFVHEHTILDAGDFGDQVIYSMTKDQCRWLVKHERISRKRAA